MLMTTEDKRLKIGEVAEFSQLPIKTVRYYEELGLLTPTVSRSDSNYRLFEPNVLTRLAFIRRSQSLGLTLREIQDILQVHDEGKLPCGEIKSNLERKVQQINEQIASLELLRDDLTHLLGDWQQFSESDIPAQTICPNLEAASNSFPDLTRWQVAQAS